MNAEREFLMRLMSQPLLKSDAVVVLMGEDSAPRLDIALQLWKQQAAPVILLSGGRSEPPRILDAKTAQKDLIGRGVSPGKILVDNDAQNTHQQAVAILDYAEQFQWQRVIVSASAYHMPRAFLTIVRSLNAAQRATELHLLALPTSQSSWVESPDGMTHSRAHLLDVEAGKIAAYTEHVASYDEGLTYLNRWERINAAA